MIYMASFSFVVKQAYTRSSMVLFCPTSVASNRRGFTTTRFHDFVNGLSPRIIDSMLKKIPHTLTVTTDDHLLATKGFDGIKLTLNIPGNEKMTETADGLRIFLDMGMGKWVDYTDCRETVDLKHEHNALFIQARRQNKKDYTRKFSGRINLPADWENFYKNCKTKETQDGGMIISVSKVVYPNSSVNRPIGVLPSRRAVANNRLGSIVKTLFSDVFDRLLGRLARELLDSFPNTLCTTTTVTGEGKDQKVSLIEDLKVSLNVPGIEKREYTAEGLCIFLDLGLVSYKDSDDQSIEAKLKKHLSALYIKGYVQKQDIRRNFVAIVNLPQDYISEPIKKEITDGGLMLTIPCVNG